jgi:hypothetical protein
MSGAVLHEIVRDELPASSSCCFDVELGLHPPPPPPPPPASATGSESSRSPSPTTAPTRTLSHSFGGALGAAPPGPGASKAHRRRRSYDHLASLKIAGRFHHRPDVLDGGEGSSRLESCCSRLSHTFRAALEWHIHAHNKDASFNPEAYMASHLHREDAPIHFILLGIDGRIFWALVAVFQCVLLAVCFVALLLLARRSNPDSASKFRLALATLGLGVFDNLQCASADWRCMLIVAVFSYTQQIYMIVIGALAVVRVFRETTRNRFIFSRIACVTDRLGGSDGAKELQVRFASNRPSTVIRPEFTMTIMYRQTKRMENLPLTNSNGIAFLRDYALVLRHAIVDTDTYTSPFASPNWREEIQWLNVSVEGFDEVLAQTVCGRQHYTFDPNSRLGATVVEGRYEDMVGVHPVSEKGLYEMRGRTYDLITFDHSKLHTLKDEPADSGVP